jgi:hypothetical protein
MTVNESKWNLESKVQRYRWRRRSGGFFRWWDSHGDSPKERGWVNRRLDAMIAAQDAREEAESNVVSIEIARFMRLLRSKSHV